GFTYRINWGDGSAAQIIAASANNGSGVRLSHVFARAGTFTVRVNATDKDAVTGPAAALHVPVRSPQSGTSTTGNAFPAQAKVNQPLRLIAHVRAGDHELPTGTVQFAIGGKNVGGPVKVSGGVATLTAAGLAGGNHKITTSYGGSPTIRKSS